MKKLLFSVLMILGLFILGCGKNGETGGIFSTEDKGRTKLEIQDVEVTERNGEKKVVKQIVVIFPETEAENELFKKALQNAKEGKEKLSQSFPDLTEQQISDVYDVLEYQTNNFTTENIHENVKKLINLENSYYNFVKNSKELRQILSEEQINKIVEITKNEKLGTVDIKLNAFNSCFRYPEEYAKKYFSK